MKFILPLAISCKVASAKKNKDSQTFSGGESAAQLDLVLAEMNPLRMSNLDDELLNDEQRNSKYNNLEIQLSWMSPSLSSPMDLSSFYNYGCHCLKNGRSGLINGGYGKPLGNYLVIKLVNTNLQLDAVDAICQQTNQCYRCLVLEHHDGPQKAMPFGTDVCDGNNLGYKYKLVTTKERALINFIIICIQT